MPAPFLCQKFVGYDHQPDYHRFLDRTPSGVSLGLHLSRKYRKHTLLLFFYYLYNCCYVALLSALLFYSLTLEKVLELLQNLIQEPSFWTGSFAQVFLCNVVISDMLYMTVF